MTRTDQRIWAQKEIEHLAIYNSLFSMSMQSPDAALLFAPYSDFTREMWNNRDTLRSLMKPRENYYDVITKKPAGKIAKKPASNKGAKKPAAQKSTMAKKPATRTNGKS